MFKVRRLYKDGTFIDYDRVRKSSAMFLAKDCCTKESPHVEVYWHNGEDWEDVGYFDMVRCRVIYTDWDGEDCE